MRKYAYLLAFVVFALAAQPSLAATIASGTVKVNGNNVTAGWVELVGNGMYAGSEISNGQYTIESNETFDQGMYQLRAIPDTSAYPQNPPTNANVNYTGTPLNQNITLGAAAKRIQVTVNDALGNPAAVTVRIKASGGGGGMRFEQKTSNGQVTVDVRPEGAPYHITVDNCNQENNGTQSCIPWMYTGEPVEVSFDQADDVSETKQVTIEGETPTATVTGHIDYQGTGFEGFIHLYNAENLFSGWMDVNGDFTVYAVPGSYKIDLLPKQSMENPDVVRYYIDDATIGGALTIVDGDNDVGDLAASYEASTVRAIVQDDSGNRLENVTANFWLAGGGEWRQITIMPGADGSVGSEAHPGTYYANAVDPTGEYFPAAAEMLIVTGDNEEPQVTLVMAKTNATVDFTVENEDGSRASSFNSFINCWDTTNNRGNGAAVVRGAASLKLVAGSYTCTTVTPQNASVSVAPVDITVAADENEAVALTTVGHDATVSGTILDQEGEVIVPAVGTADPLKIVLAGEVFGRFEVEVGEDGAWSKALPPDTYSVAPKGEEIIPVFGQAQTQIIVEAGETVENQELPAFAPDSTITTSVMTPDGTTPLAFAPVTCTYLPEGQKGDFEGGRVIEITGETDAAGEVVLPVLSQDGAEPLVYDCGVAVPDGETYIAPSLQQIEPGETKEFEVFEPDSTLTVNYDAAGETLTEVQCQAWADNGTGMVTGVDENADGAVDLEISKEAGDNWNVSCSGVKENEWFTPEAPMMVELPEAGTFDTTIDVTASPIPVPQGSSESFDATAEKSVNLAGVSLQVPANAVESGGDVTLTMTPAATNIPKNENNQNIGVPMNLQAFDDDGNVQTSFAQPIVVTMPYEEEVLDTLGVLETDLVPKFYNEAGGAWETMQGFKLDTEANTLTFSTDHFTQFGILYDERIAGSAPEQVTGVKVPKKTLKVRTAKVKWTAVDGAESYQVQLFKKNGARIKTFKEITDVKYTIAKKWLKAGKKYKVRVRAVGSNGLNGDWSDYKNFTTKTKQD